MAGVKQWLDAQEIRARWAYLVLAAACLIASVVVGSTWGAVVGAVLVAYCALLLRMALSRRAARSR